MKKFLNRLTFNLIYRLFKKNLSNIDSYLFHSKIAFKVNEKMVKNLKLKGSFETPKNLTVISYHNYKHKPLFERNMDFLGINYLSIKAETPYYFSKKTELIYSMVKNKLINTEYVLICDSDDVIFTKNPKNIIKIFKEFNCDMLFSATEWDFVRKTTYDGLPPEKEPLIAPNIHKYSGGFPQDLVMKEQKDWVNNFLGKKMYIDCGMYIFKTEKVLDILEEAVKYISYGDPETFEIPYCNSDQTIYRWVEPKFYPRIKVDYENKIFVNNLPKTKL